MTDPSSRRKLAAILSADVVGYSRLMAANEAATVETLKSYRDIITRLVVRRGGRVVNAPGFLLGRRPIMSRPLTALRDTFFVGKIWTIIILDGHCSRTGLRGAALPPETELRGLVKRAVLDDAGHAFEKRDHAAI